jgi:hypothetical protein
LKSFDPKLAFLEAHLAEHMAKVRAREDLVEVVMTVDAVTPGRALELAEALLVPAIEETGLRTGRVERVQAVRTEGRYVRLGSTG